MRELARATETGRTSRGGGGRRRWRVVAAIAAAAVAVAVVAPVLRPGTEGAQAEAAEVLRRAARVAARQPAPPRAEGYRYTRSEGAFLHGIGDGIGVWALVPVTREIWVAPDGSGRIVSTEGEPTFFGPRDRQRWEDAGRPPLAGAGTSDETFGPGGLQHVDLDSLPTDPGVLFEVIRSRAEQTDNPISAEMLVIVGDLLRETVAPPALRAALYEVAARIPGIQLVGEVADPAGRPGLAVAVQSDYTGALIRQELIFDRHTSEMLAERQVLLDRVSWLDADPPAVIGYAVYLESGIVGSTQDRP